MRQTLNSSESSHPLWDPEQITFVMLDRFWLLSKTPSLLSSSLFLMDNIRLHGIPTKIKWKIQACFTLNFKFWEGTAVKGFKTKIPDFLFLVLHQFLYQQTSFLQLSRISFNIIWKRFSSQIFLNRFTPLPQTPPP